MLESKYFWSPEISRGGSSFFLLVKKGSPRNTSMRGEILCRCWVCWAGSSCCAPAEEGEIQDRCLQPQVWPWSGGSLCTSQTDGFVSNQLPPVTAEHVPGTPYKWGCQSHRPAQSPQLSHVFPPWAGIFPLSMLQFFLVLQVGDVSLQMNFCLSLFFGEIYVSRLLSARESTLLLSPDRRVCSNTESSTLKRGRGTLGVGLFYISADSLLSLFHIPLIAWQEK